MFIPVSDWFAAFVLTIAIELPIAGVLLRRSEPDLVRLATLIAVVNLATHLAVWYVFSQLFLPGTLEYTLAAEAWAIVAEAVFFWITIRGVGPVGAGAVALVANAASFAIGRLVGGAWLDQFG